MAATRPWTVVPHRPLEQLEDNLWCIEGAVPGLPGLNRRMAIVRRADGSLLFYNAIPVDEPTLSAIRALGTPAVLLIPHIHHAIDAQAFRDRLQLRVCASSAYRDQVAQRVTVDLTLEELPQDPSLSFTLLPEFSNGETLGQVRSGEHVSYLVADAITFVRRMPGWRGPVFAAIGFTGDQPRLPWPVKSRYLKNRSAFKSRLSQLATTPGLVRVVTSHGDRVEQDAAVALDRIARGL